MEDKPITKTRILDSYVRLAEAKFTAYIPVGPHNFPVDP